MANRQISEGRQATYYIGIIIMVIGFLIFISVFFVGGPDIASDNFDEFSQKADLAGMLAVGGIILTAIGGGLMSIGSKGFAGSGVILDPEQACEDLEPWARMAGGVVKDAVDEAGINLSGITSHEDNSDLPSTKNSAASTSSMKMVSLAK